MIQVDVLFSIYICGYFYDCCSALVIHSKQPSVSWCSYWQLHYCSQWFFTIHGSSYVLTHMNPSIDCVHTRQIFFRLKKGNAQLLTKRQQRLHRCVTTYLMQAQWLHVDRIKTLPLIITVWLCVIVAQSIIFSRFKSQFFSFQKQQGNKLLIWWCQVLVL